MIYNFFRNYDDFPKFTGTLFVVNKLEMYALSAIFMLDFFTLHNFSNLFNSNLVKQKPWTVLNQLSFNL